MAAKRYALRQRQRCHFGSFRRLANTFDYGKEYVTFHFLFAFNSNCNSLASFSRYSRLTFFLVKGRFVHSGAIVVGWTYGISFFLVFYSNHRSGRKRRNRDRETSARLSKRSLELVSTSRRRMSKGTISHKFLRKESESVLQRRPR